MVNHGPTSVGICGGGGGFGANETKCLVFGVLMCFVGYVLTRDFRFKVFFWGGRVDFSAVGLRVSGVFVV